MGVSGLIRDFSDREKDELMSTIESLADENKKWCGMYKGWDAFTDVVSSAYRLFNPYKIENYLGNISDYHKEILDKKNESKEQLQIIFDNVNNVDEEYCTKVNELKERVVALRSTIGYLSDVLDPSSINNKEIYSLSREDFSMDEGISSLTDYYYDKYINGVNGEKYNWNAIEETMKKNPEDVSDAEYAALCKLLDSFSNLNSENEIDRENYEKFLNLSCLPDKIYSEIAENGECRIGCKPSPVLSSLLQKYVYFNSGLLQKYSDSSSYISNNKSSEEVQKKIFNISVLKNVISYDNIYKNGYGTKINGEESILFTFNDSIKLEKDLDSKPNGKYDYILNIPTVHDAMSFSLNGDDYEKNSVVKENALHIRTYHTGTEINQNISNSHIEYLISSENNGYVDAAVGLLTVALGFPYSVPTAIFCAGQAIMIPVDAEETNAVYNKMSDGNTIGQVLEYCGVNASITINDNAVSINYATMDENTLEARLWLYNRYNPEKSLSSQDVKEFLFCGKAENLESIKSYCDWYLLDGNGKLNDLETCFNSRKDIQELYNNKAFDSLSLDEKKEIYDSMVKEGVIEE